MASAPDVKDCFDEFWLKYEACPLKGRDRILASVCPQVKLLLHNVASSAVHACLVQKTCFIMKLAAPGVQSITDHSFARN